ncbi:hypothetical protein [Siccirubricoccus phaeus]|uniref:hypothetical protein n=1 Tax=Siccirubricoccus phaeus TaxID=2595053 RepID=UPI0011F13EE0|nr:hypothetical protein [Siccirubricoccus phaeus]
MFRPSQSRSSALAKPGGEAAALGLGGWPDRLPWPVAGLVIAGLALGFWAAIIAALVRILG